MTVHNTTLLNLFTFENFQSEKFWKEKNKKRLSCLALLAFQLTSFPSSLLSQTSKSGLSVFSPHPPLPFPLHPNLVACPFTPQKVKKNLPLAFTSLTLMDKFSSAYSWLCSSTWYSIKSLLKCSLPLDSEVIFWFPSYFPCRCFSFSTVPLNSRVFLSSFLGPSQYTFPLVWSHSHFWLQIPPTCRWLPKLNHWFRPWPSSQLQSTSKLAAQSWAHLPQTWPSCRVFLSWSIVGKPEILESPLTALSSLYHCQSTTKSCTFLLIKISKTQLLFSNYTTTTITQSKLTSLLTTTELLFSLAPFHPVLWTAAGTIILKCKANHVILWLKTLQWFPPVFQIKIKPLQSWQSPVG